MNWGEDACDSNIAMDGCLTGRWMANWDLQSRLSGSHFAVSQDVVLTVWLSTLFCQFFYNLDRNYGYGGHAFFTWLMWDMGTCNTP